MMIRHLIVFNAREGMSREECLHGLSEGRALMQIPGVLHISFGEAVAENAKYRYMFAADFESESVIEIYKNHPLHVEYADNWFRPMAPDRITTDFSILS